MRMGDKVQTLGFYTNRFVEANDASRAGAAAIVVMKSEPRLQDGPLNDAADPPMIYVDQIEEVHESAIPSVTHGLAFFRDDA